MSRTSPTSQHDLNTWGWSSTRFLSNFSTQMAPLRLTDWSSLWCPHVVAVHQRMVNHTISRGEDTKRQLKGWICPFWKSTPAEVCPTPYFSPQFSFFSFNFPTQFCRQDCLPSMMIHSQNFLHPHLMDHAETYRSGASAHMGVCSPALLQPTRLDHGHQA